MIRRPPRSTLDRSSAASDVYKRQVLSSPGGSSSLDLHALCEVPSRSIIGVHVSSIPLHPTLDDPWALPAYVQLFFRYLVEQALVVSDLITFAVPGTCLLYT